MTQEQLRIIVELFLEGKIAYAEKGFNTLLPNYKKSVDKAQKVAFQILRDAVKEYEGEIK
jgi:hypothetical protein